MEAWMSAHGLVPVARPVWPAPAAERPKESSPVSQEQLAGRRARSAVALRSQIKELAESLGVRDLEKVVAFAEFVKARRAAKAYVQRHDAASGDSGESREGAPTGELIEEEEESSPTSSARTARA
jgi:hypothetical protein